MTAANLINLTIDEKAHSYARIYSSLLSDEFQRKRAYASLVALYALVNLLEKTSYDVQKSMTIFRNPSLNEQYEISDLYVNNWHLDVRVITDGDSFLVPKSHFDNDIIPDFYAVVKVDLSLKNAQLVGFADSQAMKKEGFDYHYFSSPCSELLSYEEFLSAVSSKKITAFNEEEHNLFREHFLSLMDNEIDKNIKNKIIKHLFDCSDCKTEFCCFTGFEMVSCNLTKYPELIEDQTLNIIGAQAVDNPEYEDKEQKVYIGNEDNESKEQEQNQPEEDVTDILDELFNSDEEEIHEKEVLPEENDKNLSLNEEILEKDELEIINDETGKEDKSNLIELHQNSDDIEMILEDTSGEDNLLVTEEKEDISDIPFAEADVEESTGEDLVFIDTEPEDIIPVEDSDAIISEIPEVVEDTKEAENVQKVIVDYDEFGEPIYSYITNVSEYNDNDSTTEIEPLEDNEDNNISDLQSDITKNRQLPEEETEEFFEDDKIEKEEAEEQTEQILPADSTLEDDTDDSENFGEKDEVVDDPLFANESLEDYDDDDELSDPDEEVEEYEDEDYEEQPKRKSSKKLLVIVYLALFVIAGAGAFTLMKVINSANTQTATTEQAEIPTSDETSNMFEQAQEQDTQPSDLISYAGENDTTQQASDGLEVPPPAPVDIPPLTEQDLVKPQKTEPIGDVNKVITNALSESVSPVTITGISWLCAPELFTNKVFKGYLQNLDDVLKLNLRKNILDVTERPENNSVSIKMAIDNNGNLLRSLVAKTSGSQQIDEVVLQSIKETLESQKTQILNDSEQKSDKYYLQVVIKL